VPDKTVHTTAHTANYRIIVVSRPTCLRDHHRRLSTNNICYAWHAKYFTYLLTYLLTYLHTPQARVCMSLFICVIFLSFSGENSVYDRVKATARVHAFIGRRTHHFNTIAWRSFLYRCHKQLKTNLFICL